MLKYAFCFSFDVFSQHPLVYSFDVWSCYTPVCLFSIFGASPAWWLHQQYGSDVRRWLWKQICILRGLSETRDQAGHCETHRKLAHSNKPLPLRDLWKESEDKEEFANSYEDTQITLNVHAMLWNKDSSFTVIKFKFINDLFTIHFSLGTGWWLIRGWRVNTRDVWKERGRRVYLPSLWLQKQIQAEHAETRGDSRAGARTRV